MIWNREPVMVLAVVQTVLACAVSFGADLTADQTAAVLTATAAVLSLVARTKVTPTTE